LLIATTDASKKHFRPSLFERASFFVRFEWPFLRPGLLPGRRRAQGLSRRPSGPAKRLGLDSSEHGAMLMARQGLPVASMTPSWDNDRHSVSIYFFALARVHGIYRDKAHTEQI